MSDRKSRELEMSKNESKQLLDIIIENFGSKKRISRDEATRVKCLYDCDCTVVGGTDPIPPYGTAAGVGGYLAGSL